MTEGARPRLIDRRRVTFAAALGATVALGLASRTFGGRLPTFVASYAGDFLWAAAAFLALGLAVPSVGAARRALFAFLFAAAIEASQLYHAPWLDDLRATIAGRLVLGSGFLWSDIACYAAGVTTSALAESALRRTPR